MKELGAMNKDYLYCINQDTCIHRRGCKRWIGNYTDDEAIEEDDNNCINSHLVYDGVMPYLMLDRFRLSNGEPMK